MEATRIKAHIPVPLEIRFIAEVLRDGDPSVEVFLVGGCVRDYLFWKFHTAQTANYVFKDLDLATNLSEEEILARLRSESAQRFCIKVKEKESVDTFGVVFVSVSGKGPYEVAPYRRDIGSADGRRPERVERGTIYEDAMRRDFTINNLYYDFEKEEILDFNQNNEGVEDIKARRVRTVGNPFARFNEDKLRILRMVRFFSRLNEGLIVEHLDEATWGAIEHFKALTTFKGMSPERIQTEFLSGLAQSRRTDTYLKNYHDLDLFKAIFGGAKVDMSCVTRYLNLKNPKVVLAKLLYENEDVRELLNELKYPNEISDPVAFLCRAMNFDPKNAVDVLKDRDRRIIKVGKKKLALTEEELEHNEKVKRETITDIADLMGVTDDPLRRALLEHMAGFNTTVMSGEELMKRGYQGQQIGAQQRAMLQSSYLSSLRWYLTAKKFSIENLE
jgi:tRNA nucleotidyltransferase/poly(A) polymerase